MTQLTIDGTVNWLELVPYSKARDVYRLQNGHYPEGATQLEYWKKHPDELDKTMARKMRRSK